MGSGYRKGVLVGDYVEDLASKADINSRELSKSFTGTSTAKLDYNAVGKTGAELLAASTRDDIRLKYGKYGKTESLGNGFGGCFATMSQLAYTSPVSTHNQEGAPEAHQPLKTSDFIWTGSNIGDSKVPRTVLANRLAEERRQRLEEESSRNLFASTEKESLAQAAQDSEGRVMAKPPACRPKAEGGQEAQIGRKAVGQFCREMDRDYLKIGLRK